MSIAIAATVTTAAVGVYSANRAAKAQEGAADSANQTELEMYYQSRDDQQPWRNAGQDSLNQLSMMLGLTPEGSGAARSTDEVYKDLVRQWEESGSEPGSMRSNFGTWNGSQIVMDEPALRAAAERQAAYEASQPQKPADQNYNALSRSFTEKDFWDDPVTKLSYQFGLDEGRKGISRQASATGSLDSGKILKELTRFGTDYAGTKGNESFNRFNINQDKTFNRLASLAGVGQSAAQQTGAQAIATGQSIGNNIMGAGNARAASAIGMGNALTGAAGQGLNFWQQSQAMRQPTYSGYVNNAYQNGFGDAFTNMSNPAYG